MLELNEDFLCLEKLYSIIVCLLVTDLSITYIITIAFLKLLMYFCLYYTERIGNILFIRIILQGCSRHF